MYHSSFLTLWFSKHRMNWWAVTQFGQRKLAQSWHLATAFSFALQLVQMICMSSIADISIKSRSTYSGIKSPTPFSGTGVRCRHFSHSMNLFGVSVLLFSSTYRKWMIIKYVYWNYLYDFPLPLKENITNWSDIFFLLKLCIHVPQEEWNKVSRSSYSLPWQRNVNDTPIRFFSTFKIQYKIRAVAGQRSSPESCFANKTKMSFRAKIKKRQITGPYYTDSFSKSMTFIHQIQRYKAKSVDNEI